MAIDFTNNGDKISPHFTVHDAIWLPSWKRLANESDGLSEEIKANLIDFFNNYMEKVRGALGPIIVHVSYRPAAYNAAIGGAQHSAHSEGKACDFHAANHSIDDAKDIILKADMLEQLGLRMEKNTPTWVHLDNRELKPGGNRYFLP